MGCLETKLFFLFVGDRDYGRIELLRMATNSATTWTIRLPRQEEDDDVYASSTTICNTDKKSWCRRNDLGIALSHPFLWRAGGSRPPPFHVAVRNNGNRQCEPLPSSL